MLHFNGLSVREILASTPRVSLAEEKFWVFILTGYEYPRRRPYRTTWPL